jgi:hypothetical protein
MLLSHNKLGTMDNLNKKGLDKPKLCQLCDEEESISHLYLNVWWLEVFGHV